MRSRRSTVEAVCLFACVALLSGANKQNPPASASWLASRQAIGDVASLEALTLRGREVSGFNAITGAFGESRDQVEVHVLLPDHFLNVTERDFRNNLVLVLRTGFREDVRIKETDQTRTSAGITSPGSETGTGSPVVEQRNLARLMLALALRNDTALPLTVQMADAGPGFELRGPGGLHVFVDIDATTRLPTRIRYHAERPFYTPAPARRPGQRVVTPATQARREVEVNLILEDRRTVSGLNLPFRIREVADGVTFRITQFDEIIVNPPLRPADFR